MIGWLALATALAAPIEGRILEHGSGAAVTDAEITLPDGTVVTTDENGRFTLDLEDGIQQITVVSYAHRPADVELDLPLERKHLVVRLRPLPAHGEIVVEGFRQTSDLSRHAVDAEQAFETPGTYDDAVRLVQALPGVNIQREFSPTSGDLSVRGSLPGDNRYFLDGIEVPYLYHFNQYASVFPASQLSSLELFPSGQGVRYGDAVGAVVEARSRLDAPKAISGSVGINFITASAEVRVPIKDGWWVSASARRSYQDLVGEQTDQFTIWPVFGDFAVRAEHGDQDKGTGVFVWGSGDRYNRAAGELDVLDPVEASSTPSFDFKRDFQITGVRHHWRQGRVVFGAVHDHVKATLSGGGRQDIRTLALTSRGDLFGRFNDVASWTAGWELRGTAGWVDTAPGGAGAFEVAAEAPSITWPAPVSGTALRAQPAAYGEIHLHAGPVRFMPGLRVGLDVIQVAKEPSTVVRPSVPLIEPRLAIQWRIADQTSLKASGGRYQQRPELAAVLASPALPTTSAWQAGLTVEQAIANRVEISLDGYYKYLLDPLFQPPTGLPRAANTGHLWGVELTTRYRIRETFFVWSWIGYSRALLVDEFGFSRPSSGDQPYSGGLVASWNIIESFNVAVRYRVAAGLPYTPVDRGLYDANVDQWLPVLGDINSARMPLYQKIDLHLAYTHTFKRFSITASADLWIVPKSSAQLYPTWSYDYSEQGWVSGPQILPLLGLRAKF